MTAKNMLIATVRRCDFLVELFLIQSEGFIADIIVRIGTT